MSKQADSKLLGFIKQQMEAENKIVESVNQGIKDIQNPPVRAVLKGISMDSTKHAQLYGSALALLTTVPQAMTQENLDKQKELVQKHIDMETELIEKLEKEIPAIENKKVTFLLNSILQDERRHHELLKKVLEIIVHGETITEEEWWSVLWEGAPFHGAPGG
ncbi:MAG: ferritin-like domain-containing protein [Candidatus Bathyarchaeota archaeon]|nr:ferritin-like domain-containing protein [Candidatus Bathyarchaeota archaeon]